MLSISIKGVVDFFCWYGIGHPIRLDCGFMYHLAIVVSSGPDSSPLMTRGGLPRRILHRRIVHRWWLHGKRLLPRKRLLNHCPRWWDSTAFPLWALPELPTTSTDKGLGERRTSGSASKQLTRSVWGWATYALQLIAIELLEHRRCSGHIDEGGSEQKSKQDDDSPVKKDHDGGPAFRVESGERKGDSFVVEPSIYIGELTQPSSNH
jgi:hypothetical protein